MRFRIPVAVHLMLMQDEHLLLLRRFQTGFGDGQYSLVAGCIKGNESLTQAMMREAKEEAGIILKPDWLQVSCIIHRRNEEGQPEFLYAFLTAKQWGGEIQNREPNKCDDLRFFPLSALPDNLIPYVRQGIEHSLQGNSYVELGWEEDASTLCR